MSDSDSWPVAVLTAFQILDADKLPARACDSILSIEAVLAAMSFALIVCISCLETCLTFSIRLLPTTVCVTALSMLAILPTAPSTPKLCASDLATDLKLAMTFAALMPCVIALNAFMILLTVPLTPAVCVAVRSIASIRDAAAFDIIDCNAILYP